MSAQKVHRMKLKKAAAATAHMPLARRDKKVAKGMDEGEASVSLLAHNSSLPAADNAVSTADNAAHHHHQQQQQQQQQQQPSKQGDSSKPGKRGIRNVFGFGKNKNKSKKQLGYTLTQTPKTVKGTSNAAAISPVQVQTQKNYTKANTADKSSSPTGITPKAAKLSPFHKATSPKKANNQATEMDAVGFDAEWNPSFYDDNLMGESEKESTAKLPQSSDDEEEVSAAPSIEMTYHTSDTPHQMESHAEVTVSTSLSATSPKSSKSHLLENKTPKSTTSASENSAKSLQSKSSGRFISPRKSSSSAMPKSKSPGARAAARAIVEDYDDFGANDFDPNDSSSDEEETDTMNTTTSTGPFASQGDGDSSAFQFDLAAGSMKSRSPQSVKSSLTPAASIASSKKSNKSVAAAKAPSSPSDGGFQILMTRSSRSKGEDTYTPKQSTTQTTVASSTSMLSSLSIGKKGPSSSPSSRAISPSSNKKSAKSSQQSPSGSSILSHQTSTSSSLFPSSSNAANTPTSVVSGRSSRKRRGNGNDKSQLTSVTSATSPMSEDDDLSSALRMGSTSTSLSLASGSLSPNSTKRQQAKLVLSRAFGRHSLPPDLQPWKVEISPAEWDGRERRWKYRIQVQRQETTATASPQGEKRSPSKGSPSTMSHFTWRSLDNFVWLEQALNAEFQGALLLPLLNIAVGMTDLEQVTHEVDANLLKDWLSDILNGVRGQGELMLPHKSVDLLRSEAVEAFLYRNIRVAPLQKPANLIKSIMGDSLGEDYQLKGLAQHADQGSFYQHFRNKSRNVGSGNANNAQSPRSNSLSPCTPFSHQMQDEEPESFVDAMWTRGPLAIMAGELCGVGGCNVDPEDSPSSAGSSVSSPGTNKRFHGMACTSRALGTADTLDIQDSFVDVSTVASMQSSVIRGQHRSPASLVSPKSPPSAPRIWRLAQFPSIIKSERKLVLSYRKTALTTIEKLDILLEEESNIGTAWKRFSIAVSNLFSYEKEVENARLGDKKIHRDHMPYRKVKKSTVDECLRVMAQQKVDRSVPSLRALKGMLTAYVADLSSVSPSVDSYLEGISQMLVFEEAFEAQQTAFECNSTIGKSVTPASNSTRSENVSKDKKLKVSIFGNLQEHLKSIAKSAKGGDEKKTDEGDVMQTNSTSSDECESKMSLRATAMQRRRVVEDRVLGNERLLKDSLTTLCRSANVRTARMAWAFFKSEAMQCSLLHSAAGSLRNQIDLTNNEAVTKMVSRHHDENKEDMKTELALVQRMVNLGNMKRFPIAGVGPNSEAETIEVDSDNQDEERAKAMLRDNALQVARERVGRWNSQLAMAVMHAVGVDDANVRVEETTRELRLVRKYAIGLRENLNRCIEAVELLRNAILKGRNNSRPEKDTGHKKMTRHINETRKELFSALAKLLSGIFVSYPELPATSDSTQTTLQLLAKAGVKTNDPFGWSTPFSEWAQELKDGETQGQCGETATAYFDLKDSQTEWLLSSLSSLLNEYTQRVEVVESFVYMECVGVQLEKHFSKKRSDALTAFEKKTDITTAINIATRKRIPALLEELQAKLDKLGPDVSHTSVKEAKEAHLESKSVKSELHELAFRRLLRARETSTERVINLLQFWLKEEESACISELNKLGDTLEVLEKTVGS